MTGTAAKRTPKTYATGALFVKADASMPAESRAAPASQ